jgi:glycosyltransferase involved in cell wall biosynthesis
VKTLTIFTPTFNRAHLLPRLYESLRRQSAEDFCWLIVDDGSSDDTRELVRRWMVEGVVPIDYVFKTNGGMHTAHNVAYGLIQTEINICIDSDDEVPADAVEKIIASWRDVAHDPTVCGLVGLDEDAGGNRIGTALPPDGTRATLTELYGKYRVRGDKKLVYRSSVTREAPRYPEYEGEKLVPLGWLYTQIDRKYDLVCVNTVFVRVDYQPDGSSATIIRQYFQSPRGFRDARAVSIRYGAGLGFRLRNVIHYGVSSLILRDYAYFVRAPWPLLSLLLTPLSVAAYCWLLLVRRSCGGA